MRKIAGMPTSMIAKVTERDKKSIYNVLKGKVKFAKRGPRGICKGKMSHIWSRPYAQWFGKLAPAMRLL